MARRRSRAVWIWRGAVTGVIVGLLLWGNLRPWWNEFLLIALGSGIFTLGAEFAHNAVKNCGPRAQEPHETAQ